MVNENTDEIAWFDRLTMSGTNPDILVTTMGDADSRSEPGMTLVFPEYKVKPDNIETKLQ